MTTFPRSPRVMRGALVGLDPVDPLASIILFQYNPDTLTRTLRARAAGRDGDQAEVLRLKGPPDESVRMEVEIDATDQLEQGDPLAGTLGLFPALAQLEMLLYPKSAIVIANAVLSQLGMIEVIPPEAPLSLLVWGIKRVLPVRVTGFTITEEAFDPSLNPIRARVALDLNVLTYQELGFLSVGGALSMVNQVAKEVLAIVGSVSGAVSFGIDASVGVG